jgi:nitroimidazol reductase NimA-like FMN-containing flavoprotein (pyridoxamine 5'-phosphate oxidase superfamily)
MRRKDRERSEEFALALIERCEYAFLATADEEGNPYCIPISPALHGRTVYFHCALEGEKLQNIHRNPRVCLSCAMNTQVLPAEFTTRYQSAVAFGEARLVEDEAEKAEALRLICRKYSPGYEGEAESAIARSIRKTGICKVQLDRVTGKEK